MVWLGVLLCPCHWPLIVLALLGGTAVGGLVQAHFGWVIAASAVLSAAFIGGGYWLIRRNRASDHGAGCSTCAHARPGRAVSTKEAQRQGPGNE